MWKKHGGKWVHDQRDCLGEPYKWRKGVSSQVFETRNWSSMANAGVVLLLDQVKDLPPSRISIRPRAPMRSWNEPISLMFPSQPWRLSKNQVMLKSLITAHVSDEHQACIEWCSWKKRLSVLSLGPYTEVIQKIPHEALVLNFTDIENLVEICLSFSKSFSFHPISYPSDAPVKSSIPNSFIRVPPIVRSNCKEGKQSFISWNATTSKLEKNKISNLCTLIKTPKSLNVSIQNNH